MGQLWDLIQDYRDRQEWEVPVAHLADKIGVARSTPRKWEDLSGGRLPEPQHLRATARVCQYPYLRVLDAALVDTGFLTAGESQGQWAVTPDDLIELVENDERVAAILSGPGSGRDRARALAHMLRGRTTPAV